MDEAIIKKFVDENNRAYAICSYEKGEPKYSFVAKQIWMRVEDAELIMSDTKLTEEQKQQRIKEMLNL